MEGYPKGIYFPQGCILESGVITYIQEYNLTFFDFTIISLNNINGNENEIVKFKCDRMGVNRIEKEINLKIDNEMNIYIIKLQPENLALKHYVAKENYSKEDYPMFNGIKFLYRMEEK